MSLRFKLPKNVAKMIDFRARYPSYTLPDPKEQKKRAFKYDRFEKVKTKKPGPMSPAFIKLMRKENVEYILDVFKLKREITSDFVSQ